MARVFMASERESLWHAVELRTGGPQPVARCGHVIRGRVHRRLGRPEKPRVVCGACSSGQGRQPEAATELVRFPR
ncbi:hypothetical protein GCM10027271_28430 [Saccharopolyspora gloriosae]|uniref:Uncharacterized protein n=1 Tax=Saccharopolyspora gloriosae TaxID=455344 RepID=A0A840NQB8_9PSEU|nr:hypothetical protein [Saccharopolyspora gloriosae]MBB5071322.1 hypothetical protein [Saccharopolyspora gloriosae]